MTDRRSQLDATAVACIVLCCVLWGINQTAAKAALAEVPPLLQAALRSAGASVLVLLWSRRQGVALFKSDGTLGGGLLSGVLFALEFGCIFYGLQYTHASRMIVFIYTATFVVALGMPFISRSERLRPGQFAGLVLAFAGVAWAFSEGFGEVATSDSAHPLLWLGDLLGLAAAVLWGATTLAIRATRLATAPAEKTLFYQLSVSAVLLWSTSLISGESWPSTWSTLAISSLFFQVVIITFASYLLWFWLVRHYPATLLSSFTLLTPIAGLVAGVVLLDEPLTLRLIVALLAVCVGIWLVNKKPASASA